MQKLWMMAGAALLLVASGSSARTAKTELVPDGAPQSCVNIGQINNTTVRADNVIDFRMNNGKVYRNTLPNKCPSLGFEKAFTYATSLSQLCNTDIITVLHQFGGPWRGASCGLGQFQPMKKVPTKAAAETPAATPAK